MNKYFIFTLLFSIVVVYLYYVQIQRERRIRESIYRQEDEKRRRYEASLPGMIERLDAVSEQSQNFVESDNYVADRYLDQIEDLENKITEKSIFDNLNSGRMRENHVFTVDSNHGDFARNRLRNEEIL